MVSLLKITDDVLFFKLKLLLILIFIALFSTTIIRLLLIFSFASSYFNGIIFNDVVLGLLHGLRYDFALISRYFMPLQLLFLLPIKNIRFIQSFFLLNLLIIFLFVCFSFSDAMFFSMFSKHISSEIVTIRGNLEFMVPYIIKEFWIYIIALILLLCGVARLALNSIPHTPPIFDTTHIRLTHKFLNLAQYINLKKIIVYLISIMLISFITIVGTRGKLSFYTVPIKVSDALLINNQYTADISLSGVFSMVEYVRKFKKAELLLNNKEAINLAQSHIITKNEIVHDNDYPFLRSRISSSLNIKNKNIVVIFFESWDKEMMERYPNAIPNFLKLKDSGVFFPNFYSMGNRSLLGITSVLFSIPYVPTLPYLNGGLEIHNFSRLGKYFNDMGHDTLFVQTDTRSAEKMNEIAKYMDFKDYFAKEDIPTHNKNVSFYKGFDWEGFEFLLAKINKINNKFLAFFYTSSTHTPYLPLLSEEHKIYEGENEVEQYLNRLFYADAALGNFFTKAKNEDLFNDTIFIMLPDHRTIFSNSKMPGIADRFSSFMLIYAPSIFKAGINDNIATQEDILPTILDIIDTKEVYSSTGTSVFDNDRKDIKFIFGEDGYIYIVSKNEAKKIIYEGINLNNNDEKTALAIMEALYHTISNDKWAKNKPHDFK